MLWLTRKKEPASAGSFFANDLRSCPLNKPESRLIPFHENLDTIRSRTASPAPSAQELLA